MLLFSNSKSSNNGCSKQPNEGPLNLQPCSIEANGATATPPAMEVSLPELRDTSMLQSFAGMLQFSATQLGDSLSTNESNENVPPHQKLAIEHKWALMICIEHMHYQPHDSHTKKSCCIYEVIGAPKNQLARGFRFVFSSPCSV